MAASPAPVVFAVALATAVATGAGVLPFAFRRLEMPRWLGAGNAVASGVIGASAGLVIEGIHRDALRTAIGALAGGHGSYCQRRSRKHHAWLSSWTNALGASSDSHGHQRKGTWGSGAKPHLASGSGVRSILPSLPVTRVDPGDDDRQRAFVAAIR